MSVDILGTMEASGYPVKAVHNHGRVEYTSACPLEGDGEDRFQLVPDERRPGRWWWWCRQCGERGDDVDLYQRLTGATKREALEAFGIARGREHRQPRPAVRRATPPRRQPPKERIPPPEWQDSALALIARAREDLLKYASESALRKQLAKRHLSIADAESMGIGWIPCGLYVPAETWGLPPGKRLWIPRGLIVPVYRRSGVLRLKVRMVDRDDIDRSDGAKWRMVRGSGIGPLVRGAAGGTLIVTESELDALQLQARAPDGVAVAGMGSAAWPVTEEALPHFREARSILLALDRDDAGGRATSRFMDVFPNAVPYLPAAAKGPGDMPPNIMDAWISHAVKMDEEEAEALRTSWRRPPPLVEDAPLPEEIQPAIGMEEEDRYADAFAAHEAAGEFAETWADADPEPAAPRAFGPGASGADEPGERLLRRAEEEADAIDRESGGADVIVLLRLATEWRTARACCGRQAAAVLLTRPLRPRSVPEAFRLAWTCAALWTEWGVALERGRDGAVKLVPASCAILPGNLADFLPAPPLPDLAGAREAIRSAGMEDVFGIAEDMQELRHEDRVSCVIQSLDGTECAA